jgi:hypothetical protein
MIAGCAYQAGSFRSPTESFVGQHASVGCLDVAIERRADLSSGGAVVGYAFGNRCDHPAVVDLRSVAVVGRTNDGREKPLLPYDPTHSIIAMQIDGRTTGREAIAYPSDSPLREVCIDAGSIAHVAATEWLCFTSEVP